MDQICTKKIFLAENKKSEQHHWILHIRISLSINFYLNLTILIVWTKLAQKGISGQKRKRWTSLSNSTYLKRDSHQILTLSVNFDFLDHICPKRVFPIKSRKIEHHHWILHIRINVGIKFQVKLILLTFWTKFAQKSISHQKQKKRTSPLNSVCSN